MNKSIRTWILISLSIILLLIITYCTAVFKIHTDHRRRIEEKLLGKGFKTSLSVRKWNWFILFSDSNVIFDINSSVPAIMPWPRAYYSRIDGKYYVYAILGGFKGVPVTSVWPIDDLSNSAQQGDAPEPATISDPASPTSQPPAR